LGWRVTRRVTRSNDGPGWMGARPGGSYRRRCGQLRDDAADRSARAAQRGVRYTLLAVQATGQSE
jgi:hypothetical protein